MKLYFYSISFFLSLFLLSCKNTSHQDATKKYQFALHLSAGAKYYFNINTETVSRVLVAGKDMETNSQSEIGLIYEVVGSSPDSIQVKITYDQLKFAIKGKDGQKEIDAANSGHSFDDMEKQLAAIKGASVYVVLNKKGEVLEVTGNKEIADKLVTTLHVTNPASESRLREQFKKFIGDDFIRNNLSSQFSLFPDTAVVVGDSWILKNKLSSDVEVDASSTCTFDDLDGKLATVTSAAQINTDDKLTITGTEVPASIKGSQKGKFITDIGTGLLMEAKTTIALEGSVQSMGKDYPLSIKITKLITSK
ncbi:MULTISPECIES: DUF6263 family protein [Niastella]|uniref:Lipoprotein n=1 Tax=Niastella soli TaxID=2821487 RepID=A0ABS3Z2L7_9BACT|nr:DUF6263 family protein [Niastella soli]MBO9204405.1 hypothetical protein [Niastella soli]